MSVCHVGFFARRSWTYTSLLVQPWSISDDEPSTVARERRTNLLRRVTCLGVDDRILRRVGPELVEPDVLVRGAVGVRRRGDRRKALVVEAVARGGPGDAREPRARDDVDRALLVRRDVDHVERGLVRVVLLHHVGDALAVVGGLPPAERGAAVGRPLGRIEEHLLLARRTLRASRRRTSPCPLRDGGKRGDCRAGRARARARRRRAPSSAPRTRRARAASRGSRGRASSPRRPTSRPRRSCRPRASDTGWAPSRRACRRPCPRGAHPGTEAAARRRARRVVRSRAEAEQEAAARPEQALRLRKRRGRRARGTTRGTQPFGSVSRGGFVPPSYTPCTSRSISWPRRSPPT